MRFLDLSLSDAHPGCSLLFIKVLGNLKKIRLSLLERETHVPLSFLMNDEGNPSHVNLSFLRLSVPRLKQRYTKSDEITKNHNTPVLQ